MLCFFKKKTAYEVRISDWSSDVCSSDLIAPRKCRLCDYNFMMMKYLDGEAAIALNGIHGCENRRSYRRPVRTLRQVEGAAHLVRDRARVKRAEIVRAPCRERVCQYVSIPVVAVSLKKKTKKTTKKSN